MRRFVSLGLILAVLVAPIALTPVVRAIESFGIGAVPANPRADNPRTKSIFVYSVEPGKTVQDGIKIVNGSSSVKTISVYPVDSQASSDGAFACAQAVDQRKAVGNWIQLEKSQVTLQPNATETVPFTLTVPANTSVGEHNGCIAVQDVSPSATTKTENGIVLSFRSAIRVAVTVPGAIVTKLSLTDVKSEQRDQKIQISPILKNTGNVSVDAKLNVKLLNIFGATVNATTGQFPVLTNTESRFNFELDRPFWGGWYAQEVDATYAQLSEAGKPDNQLNLGTQKKWLFVAPKPAAAAVEIGVPLALLAVGYYVFKRRRDMNTLRTNSARYRIREGDDIQKLAAKLNMSWKQLAKINHLKAPYTLKPGDTLHVPKRALQQKTPRTRK